MKIPNDNFLIALKLMYKATPEKQNLLHGRKWNCSSATPQITQALVNLRWFWGKFWDCKDLQRCLWSIIDLKICTPRSSSIMGCSWKSTNISRTLSGPTKRGLLCLNGTLIWPNFWSDMLELSWKGPEIYSSNVWTGVEPIWPGISICCMSSLKKSMAWANKLFPGWR